MERTGTPRHPREAGPACRHGWCRRWTARLGLIAFGLVLGAGLAEGALRIAGLPRFHRAHPPVEQFVFPAAIEWRGLYVNAPSRDIVFEYDSDPRGYFAEGHRVHHPTNTLGFRGPEFEAEDEPGALRVVCLGDSITFGEGVHFQDTWPEATRRLLEREHPAARIGFLNFGVGGYNAAQCVALFKRHAERFAPDAVVLGFAINDAAEELFRWDPLVGRPVRLPLEESVPLGLDDPLPPDGWLYRSRLVQLWWKRRELEDRAHRTVTHYQELYREDSTGWQRCRRALLDLARRCEQRGLPLFVLIFPLLHRLEDDHPLAAVHDQVRGVLADTSARVIDLLPLLRGLDPTDLVVHPTDPHPNEQVHATAARALLEAMLREPALRREIEAAAAR